MKAYWLVALSFLFCSSPALAKWSVNLGYNNPPGSEVGLNFLGLGSNWAFEIGFGYVNAEKDEDDKSHATAAGAMSLKYLFSNGGFRPYMQLGTGYGLGASDSGVGLGVGGSLYGGLGFFAMGSKFYGYTSINKGNTGGSFFQVGLGMNF